MKFFESKYYAPLLNTAETTEWQVIRDSARMQQRSGYGRAIGVLTAYCTHAPNIDGLALSRAAIENDWVLVTDLIAFKNRYRSDYKDSELEDLYQTVYFHPGSEFFVCLAGDRLQKLAYDEISTIMLYCPFNVNPLTGFELLQNEGYIYPISKPTVPKMGVLTKNKQGLQIEYRNITCMEIDFLNMYEEDFKLVSDKIVDCVNDMDSTGLIILHGVPGTGKTNYIRWLSGQSKRSMVFIPPDMVTTLTGPSFIEFLLKNPGLTFIVEDAESTLSPRMGSERSVVSSILNLTDGLLGDMLKCQFICTFNTELTNIDTALLRPGRLLVRHEFTNLSVDSANRYLKSVNSTLTVTAPTSLSELTNLEDLPMTSKIEKPTAFGFMSH